MKKNKKLLLALGTIATVATPVAAVVSCGSTGATGTTYSDGAVTSKINNYVTGSTVNGYLPTDSTKWYSPIVGDRVHDESGNGITEFGLFNGTNQPTYDFGTLENSVAYNLGYLQNGKLLMISYYKAHPVIDNNDIRSSLTQLGTVLEKTIHDYFTTKEADFIADAGTGADVQTVLDTLKNYKVEDIIKSSAQNLTKFDYKGLFGLAKIFSQDKYINATDGSPEDKLGKAVMKHIGGAFNKYSWELHKQVTTVNKLAENTKLFYAYDEVMGYSWDAFTGILGDRKTPGIGIVSPDVQQTLAVDHNNLIGNWSIKDGGKKDLKQFETATNSVGPYAAKLFELAGTTFTASSALYNEANNETLGKGIYAYDKGTPRYNSKGEVIEGIESVRYLKFGLFDGITITPKGGAAAVTFNSDSIDPNDALSINGTAFKAAITAGASKISAHVKTGQKYINGKGVPTNELVKPEDFWTYVQNASYSTVGQRNKVGTFVGSKDLPIAEGKDEPRNNVAKAFEDAISTNSNVNKSTTWSSPSKTEASTLPFFWDDVETQYGVEALKDTADAKSKFLSVDGSITFNFKDNADESSTQLLWNHLFANPGTENMIALPTENIVKQSTAFVDTIKVPAGTTADEIKKSKGVQYGAYYDYSAQKLEDFAYAGRYYAAENNTHHIVWKKNNSYSGTWTNKDAAPDSFTNEYIDQSSAYGQAFETAYEAGDIFTAPISDPKLKSWYDDLQILSDDEKKAKGITYIKPHTSAGDVGERFPTLALPFSTKSSTTAKYYFGDNFAKVMYGDTMKNTWEAPTLEKLAESLFHGTGLEFRSSLQAGINPYALAHDDSTGAMGAMSTYGPEAAIPGIDVAGNPATLVLDTEIFNRAAFGVNFVEVSDDEYRQAYTQGSGSSVFHVAGDTLTKIKANIADALEKAGVTEGDIVSELPLDYKQGLNSLNTAKSLQNYLNALNSFNSKIHFVAIANPAQLLKDEK